MYVMSNTATYIPGRHRPFDLTSIEWQDELPPKPERKTPLFEGQLRSFADFVRAAGSTRWACYPFNYKTEGGARASCTTARKTHGEGLVWESRGTRIFAKAVTS